jgi:DNA mismatch repair protein MSH6
MLTTEYDQNPLVSLNYMSFVSDEAKYVNFILFSYICFLMILFFSRQVTFLYKLAQGACPKSFGMNVAAIAGVDQQVRKTLQPMNMGI